MLKTLGHGISPMAFKPLFTKKYLDFLSALPPEITFTRNAPATCLNTQGKMVQVAAHQPRLDHAPDGTPLGLLIEPAATNKCEGNNINPVTLDGFTTSGTGTLELVNDSAALAAAGLDAICTSGMVYKASATSSGSFIVYIPGNAGVIVKHTISLYARGEGSGVRTGRITLGGSTLDIAPAGEPYARAIYEGRFPDATTRKFTVIVDPFESVYFTLYQMEEGERASSVIPVSGTAVTRPADRAVMNNLDQAPFFNPAQGYMTCRYSLERLMTEDSYIAVIHDGSSANTIGLRMDETAHTLRAYLRSQSTSQFISANQDVHIPQTLNSAGIRWNGAEAGILSGGEAVDGAITALPSALNQLEIGARNGGASPFHGHIQSIEIGTKNMTQAQLGAKLVKPSDLIVIGGGQSLMRGHFSSQASQSEGGKQQHRLRLWQALRGSAVILLNGSTGGSAASKTSDAVNYWWDLATQTRGPAFEAFYTVLGYYGLTPSHIWGAGLPCDRHQHKRSAISRRPACHLYRYAPKPWRHSGLYPAYRTPRLLCQPRRRAGCPGYSGRDDCRL